MDPSIQQALAAALNGQPAIANQPGVGGPTMIPPTAPTLLAANTVPATMPTNDYGEGGKFQPYSFKNGQVYYLGQKTTKEDLDAHIAVQQRAINNNNSRPTNDPFLKSIVERVNSGLQQDVNESRRIRSLLK